MKKIDLYTDGSCSGNPGPGGWGVVLRFNGLEKELSGGERDTTNNRMELTAVIEGLKALKEQCEVTIYSDSQYFCKAINEGWLKGWIARGWKKADKSPVLNVDLWQEIKAELDKHTIKIVWVKGHADNEFNNRCDRLAVTQTEKHKR